jgi:hypothetical protein
MPINEIATIQFPDIETGREAIAVIRTTKREVALCLSLEKGGDVEVFLPIEDCESLVEALQQAILAIKKSHSDLT